MRYRLRPSEEVDPGFASPSVGCREDLARRRDLSSPGPISIPFLGEIEDRMGVEVFREERGSK
jgi:hypothetical protein